MKKIETLFIGLGLIGCISVAGFLLFNNDFSAKQQQNFQFPSTQYGDFLASQHAVYINDFEKASNFMSGLADKDYAVVKNSRLLADFLSGKLPQYANLLKDEKNTASQLIYDAYLVSADKWQEMYNRHKKDESTLAAPLRIWSAVAINHITETLKFIDSLPTNDSWKNFVKGQIYAVKGNAEKAKDFFSKVKLEFMNINDYLYIMSFYNHYGLNAEAENLKNEFTIRPGGMYMLDYEQVPDWEVYSGLKNALGFSLIQTVSHTQIMMYSDLSVLLLRFAEITAPSAVKANQAINYYLGQFFFNTQGNYKEQFDKISPESPFYLFGLLRTAEKSGDMRKLEKELEKNPLFVPAVNTLIGHHIKNGNKRAALKVVNNALEDKNLSDSGRAFFLKSRAQIHYVFGDLEKAQEDIHTASEKLLIDPEILSLQAKIWARQNREIENAYDYAMSLVKRNPSDIMAWDTLGLVVEAREGVDAALEIIERVGQISVTCSSLFENLGDLYVKKGNYRLAKEAYQKAIDLADDGLTVVSNVEKKLRKIK